MSISSSSSNPRRLIVGISGASGIVYGVRILQVLQHSDIETHLVMSDSARMTLATELDMSVKEVEALASEVHNAKNIGATISSGSFKTMGMVVAPCSIKSLSEIAYGMTGGLLSRAADVVLKERRKLILVVRDTPYNLIHINNMKTITEAGGIICPATPSFYSLPSTLEEVAATVVNRVIDLAGFDHPSYRWGEQ